MFTKDTAGVALRLRADVAAPLEGLGEAVHKTPCMLKAVYDFASLGGAVGNISLVDDAGYPAVLPAGAVVTKVLADVVTAVTSGGSATLGLKALADGDLLTATAKASLASGFLDGNPVNTAATVVGPTTVATQVLAQVGTAALTAGKMNFYIYYVIR